MKIKNLIVTILFTFCFLQSYSQTIFKNDFFNTFYMPFGRADNIMDRENKLNSLQNGVIKSIITNNYFKDTVEGDPVPAFMTIEISNGPGKGQKVSVDYSTKTVLTECATCLIFLNKMKVGKRIKFSVASNGHGDGEYFYFTEVQLL